MTQPKSEPMSEPKTHSPTPWAIAGMTVIWSPSAKAIVAGVSALRETDEVKYSEPHVRTDPDGHEICANAAHIVHCVNTHDELVAALKNVVTMCAFVGLPERVAEDIPELACKVNITLEVAWAALAKAEARKP